MATANRFRYRNADQLCVRDALQVKKKQQCRMSAANVLKKMADLNALRDLTIVAGSDKKK